MTVKKQYIYPISTQYFRDRTEEEPVNAALLEGRAPDRSFHFQANLVTITPLTDPLDALKNLTYSAQLMPDRAIALVSMLKQSITELAYSIPYSQYEVKKFRAEET